MSSSSQKVVVLQPLLKFPGGTSRSSQAMLEEAVGLALAISLYVELAQVVSLAKIVPSTYMGQGKVQEIAEYVNDKQISLVIVNSQLSPIQQRNLENAWCCKVIDRTALILEIFGERAQTREGKLQVDLAALEYQKSRLVRSWTHLERQRGGGGFLGGPGERQIESDRRDIRKRISNIKKQLEKVVKTRQLHRKSRKKVPFPVVALVGYTNAGKSTLFNQLTAAGVMAEDKLFATLDPTMRLIQLGTGEKVILSDTVGFISDLPTELIAAFRATLEEVVESDLILHVRDMAHPDSDEQKADVLEVLAGLGLETKLEGQCIDVFNKTDLLDRTRIDNPYHLAKTMRNTAAVSALTGEGVDYLLRLISIKLSEDFQTIEIELDASQGQQLAWVYQHGKLLERNEKEDKIYLKMAMSCKDIGRYKKMWG